MIVSRFLGLFAQPHKVSQTKVTVEFDKEQFIFRQNRVIQAGWKGETESETETVKWEKECGSILISPSKRIICTA